MQRSMTEQLNPSSVNKFLQANPTFLHQWILTNISSEVLTVWLEDLKRGTSKRLSESLSAHGSLLLRSVGDNHVDFITEGIFNEIVVGRRRSLPPARQLLDMRRSDLAKMDDRALFMQLVRDIANELDVNMLCYKILWSVCYLTKSERASLFLVRGTKEEKYLVSKLFDVCETSSIYETLHDDDNTIRVPFGKGIAGFVALKKEPINIEDAYQDPRFNKEIDTQTGFRTRALLCLPLLNSEGNVIGVAQIMNKAKGTQTFNDEDEALFRDFLVFCGIGLTNAQLFEMSVNEYKQNQLLLNLARGIFLEQTNIEKMVERILLEISGLIQCQRYFFYLIASENEEIYISQAFDMNADRDNEIKRPSEHEVSMSKLAVFAKEVARSKELRIMDKHRDPWFQGKQLIDFDNFKISNVLTVPIINFEKQVVGVIQMINKFLGNAFNAVDVNSVETFAIYCGHGIHNCHMYEDIVQLMAKQKVHLEVLSFHVVASPEETRRLMNAKILDADNYRLYQWDFTDQAMDDFETAKAATRLLQESGIQKRFAVPYETLCRWMLSVKKNYRPVKYHNWRHALNVAQSMFTLLFTGHLKVYMDDFERCALVVAALCHDLDHRGTNNSFQLKKEHPLAILYSTSTLEHHHFDHCVLILNSEGNNIFGALSSDQYRRMIKLIEQCIIATDLALFFVKRGNFESLVNNKNTNWRQQHVKALLRDMMMTACDLAAICKPWEVQLKVAELVAMEFFDQGDMERTQLGLEPIAIMDRNKKDELPKMQVGFIDSICLPLFKGMASLEPRLEPLYEGCLKNRDIWSEKASRSFAGLMKSESSDPVEFARPIPTSTKATKYKVPIHFDDQTKVSVHSLDAAQNIAKETQPRPKRPPKKRNSQRIRRADCCRVS